MPPAVSDGTAAIDEHRANRRQTGLRVVAFAALFVLFFVPYRWGVLLRIADWIVGGQLTGIYSSWQADSDQLVVDRLRENIENGLFSHGLALGANGSYEGQLGLGGWLATLPATAFGTAGPFGVGLMHSLVAAFSAAIAVAATVAIRRVLSVGAAVLLVAGLLQPWITFAAQSIYWTIGLKLLPAIVVIILLSRGRDRGRTLLLATGISTAFTLAAGYEFVTVVLACLLAVITYFAITRDWTLREIINRIGSTCLGFIGGFVLAVIAHIAQLALNSGNIQAAIASFLSTVTKRTGAGPGEVDTVYAESLSSSPADVLGTYLSMPVFGAPTSVPLVGLFTIGMIIVVCLILLVVRSGASIADETPSLLRWRAMALAWAVSLLGPIGWFLLGRPHSFIHVHINYILWFLPVLPLGLALLCGPFAEGIRRLRSQRSTWMILVGLTVLVAIGIAYSYLTRR